jgi:hypothetical protein
MEILEDYCRGKAGDCPVYLHIAETVIKTGLAVVRESLGGIRSLRQVLEVWIN